MFNELDGVIRDGYGPLGIFVRPVFGLIGRQLTPGPVVCPAVGFIVAALRGMGVHVPLAEVSSAVFRKCRLRHLRYGGRLNEFRIVGTEVRGLLELCRGHAELN